jgi:hypothetical protein
MPLSPESKTAHEIVLRDLEDERSQVEQQIVASNNRVKEINQSISTLRRRLNPEADGSSSTSPTSSRLSSKKYAFMSVRWAILDLLAESEPKTTAEIAEALSAAGVQSKAANFANNVSAVLSSTMKEQPHNEVRQLQDGKWELTENGKSAIEHIRTTPKFQGAMRGPRSFARF